jgi:hypothetical protein
MIKRILTPLLLLYSISSFATTWYVSADGSDADRGTKEHPFLTIQKAHLQGATVANPFLFKNTGICDLA